ncbi:MAG: NAD-dependent DNA ligase LigA [Bacilli bacterium]|nr:NAD-dependent DNA ligase LigA [Bacilli bacterium]
MRNIKSKERIEELCKQIKKYNQEYYEQNNPSITDAEYDSLMDELINLETRYPQFKLDDSPTDKVGGSVQTGFRKIKHQIPMLSLADVFNEEEIRAFDTRVKKSLHNPENIEYVVELKIDGLAISLNYEDGKLKNAVTRGNGIEGEVVTQNVIFVNGIPSIIDTKQKLEVRGEIYISKNNLKKLNGERIRKGEPLFANARNASAGSVRQLDPKVAAERKLEGFWYYLVNPTTFNIYKQSDALEYIKKIGFKVNDKYKICANVDEVLAYINQYKTKRLSLPYDIDGIVIKVNEFKYYDLIGYTSKNPKWAVAYKFPPKEVETTLRKIVYNIGRTGKITPNALFDPIRIAGTIVRKASLHNENFIIEKKIFIGQKIIVRKAGDIIPEVVGLASNSSVIKNNIFRMINKCPICNSELIKKNSVHYCLNEKCEAKQIRKIIYFASKNAMNISGLGEKIVEELFNLGFLRTVVDIYKLENFKEKIIDINGWSNKSFDNLILSIKQSKKNSLEKLLIGFGIPRVSNKIINILIHKYKNINDWKKLTFDELINIRDIGQIAAENICVFFKDQKNLLMLDELQKIGVNTSFNEIEKNKNNFFYNKNVVLTGVLKKYSRFEATNILKNNGAQVQTSVSKNTDIVVCGEKPGNNKLTMAQSLNIIIINEEDFLKKLEI